MEIERESPDAILVLGDIFGYYPWAAETYRQIRELEATCILGNHDVSVLELSSREPQDQGLAIRQNVEQLRETEPEALDWLSRLPATRLVRSGTKKLKLFHGTPDDPLNGRYHTDNTRSYAWFPQQDETVILGHTHYPLVRHTEDGGLVANPGSVGQPRDGDVRASWAVLHPHRREFEIRRTPYDVDAAVRELMSIGWDGRAIRALRKNYTGPLQTATARTPEACALSPNPTP